jgi:hypothetical protein
MRRSTTLSPESLTALSTPVHWRRSANFVAGGTVAGGNLGRSLQLTPAADGNQNLEAPNIDTAFTAIQLSITPSTAYTIMAWVNFASTVGDNMIFGQNGAIANPANQVLHNGSRNGYYHSGHWGDDIGPDQGINIATGTGIWHHVAYTNDTAGTQSIFVDGVQVANGATGTGGGMDNSLNILIGTSNNGGSFSGMVDEIKMYNEVLTAAADTGQHQMSFPSQPALP